MNHSPQHYFTGAAILAVAAVALCLVMLLDSPWFGVELDASTHEVIAVSPEVELAGLNAGYRVVGFSAFGDDPVILNQLSLVSDPDRTGSFPELRKLFIHVGALYEATRNQESYVHLEDGRVLELKRESRSIASLPSGWWLIAAGIIPFIVSAGVWSYRRKDVPSQLLLIAGTSFMVMALTNLIYAYRQPGIDPSIFEIAVYGNRVGTLLFFYMYVAIFWVYPKRLGSDRVVIYGFFIVLLLFINEVSQTIHWPGDPFAFPLVVSLLLSIVLIVIQLHYAKNNPLDYAALQWFVLALMAGMVIVTGLYFLPTIFGSQPILSLESAFAVGIISYLGLIMAVARYKLFELGTWWLSAWMWLLGGTAVIALDVAIAFYLNVAAINVVAVSLLIVGWVYFPIRQWLWRRLFWSGDDPMKWLPRELLKVVVDGEGAAVLSRNWHSLLKKLFEPMQMDFVEKPMNAVKITDEGLSILVPDLGNGNAVRLSYRSKGRKLFSSNDTGIVSTLLTMARPAIDAQLIKERATKQERERIMRDLHDDVCSRLLTLRCRVNDEANVEIVNSAMQSLRETIYSLNRPEGGIIKLAIAEWRSELADRLEGMDIELIWHVDEDMPDYIITAMQRAYIGQVIREAVSNAIKHSRTNRITIEFLFRNNDLIVCVKNNGHSGQCENWLTGTGLSNMKRRISELGGTIEWVNDEEECSMLCSISVKALEYQ